MECHHHKLLLTHDFNVFINDMKLLDVLLLGHKFTWFSLTDTIISCIDRCLVSPEWLSHWPQSVLLVLNQSVSDHCPLILKHDNFD